MPSTNIALSYQESGLSIIPVNADKRPALKSWTEYQHRLPTEAEIRKWFRNGARIAVIGGSVSRNLEVLDFDSRAVAFEPWAEYVKNKDPGLYNRLVIEKSPHGKHVLYRCTDPVPGNTKLAMNADKTCLIETRGQGGYCLVFPSLGYELIQGSFADLPIISLDERNLLIDAARAQNQTTDERIIIRGCQPMDHNGNVQPGQDFDQRGDIRALLLKHGWKTLGTGQDGRERWQRPGKNGNTHSATLTDGKVFYAFSSNADPFEPAKAYGPFGVYATLEHGGDFKKATKTLSSQGYGRAPQHEKVTRNDKSAPTMADLREYIDLCVVPGQKITTEEICRGLSCYKRDERKVVYGNLGRLCKEGILKKDDYHHGGYRRAIAIESFDLGGDIAAQDQFFNIKLPLDLGNFIKLKSNQLLQTSGRYDAGKTSFVFHTIADNYERHKIILIISDENDLNAIKERMDGHGIPRPHKNITVYPMKPGYEELIPTGPCIVLIDYIRADQNPFETDAQIQRILKNLEGGVCIFATQKHPGLDRPVGGQFAVHASHHIVLLDRWKDQYTCKIYRSKSARNLEGLYRTFKFDYRKRLIPVMDTWKQGQIKWEKDAKPGFGNDSKDSNDSIFDAVKPGGPPVYKEKKKERSKERKRENTNPQRPEVNAPSHVSSEDFSDISLKKPACMQEEVFDL